MKTKYGLLSSLLILASALNVQTASAAPRSSGPISVSLLPAGEANLSQGTAPKHIQLRAMGYSPVEVGLQAPVDFVSKLGCFPTSTMLPLNSIYDPNVDYKSTLWQHYQLDFYIGGDGGGKRTYGVLAANAKLSSMVNLCEGAGKIPTISARILMDGTAPAELKVTSPSGKQFIVSSVPDGNGIQIYFFIVMSNTATSPADSILYTGSYDRGQRQPIVHESGAWKMELQNGDRNRTLLLFSTQVSL